MLEGFLLLRVEVATWGFTMVLMQRDSKAAKKRLLDPQSDLQVTFGTQKVSFWLVAFESLCRKREKSLLVLFWVRQMIS